MNMPPAPSPQPADVAPAHPPQRSVRRFAGFRRSSPPKRGGAAVITPASRETLKVALPRTTRYFSRMTSDLRPEIQSLESRLNDLRRFL